MAKVRLTDKYAAAVKVEAGQDRLEVFDQDVKGLILRVTASGRKSWVFRYRASGGTQRRHALGQYWTEKAAKEAAQRRLAAGKSRRATPELDTSSKGHFLTVEQARFAARALVNDVARGADPSAIREKAQEAVASQPIKTVADLFDAYMKASASGEWIARKKKKRLSTMSSEQWLWDRHVSAKIGTFALEDVKTDTIKNLLRDLVAAGLGTTSNRVRSFLGQMFRFALHEERFDVNPVSKIKPLHEETPRARVLSDSELRSVWKALSDPTGLKLPAVKEGKEPLNLQISERVRVALKLLILTLKRRAEVAGMALAELDLDQAGWTLPAHRTKAGRADFVPLSPDALALVRHAISIQDLERGTERVRSSFVFAHRLAGEKHITPSALSHALRDLRLALNLPRLTPHDLRRTAASIMASERLKVSVFLIGKLLSHSGERGGAAAVTSDVYVQYQFASEKRAALTAWSSLLAEIVGEREPANLVSPG